MNIAIFASGTGSNAINLINFFSKEDSNSKVVLVVTNNPSAPIIDSAKNLGVEVNLFERKVFKNEIDTVLEALREKKVNLVILAGFLLMIPPDLLNEYPNRIINLHPSLLPKYGGKGMYGMNVHEAVISAGEKTSGITIHLANEEYDKGKILAQFTCKVDEGDTPEKLAKKIHELEHENFPIVVKQYIDKFVHS